MFSHDVEDPVSGCCGVFNVALYNEWKYADEDLYNEMKNDDTWDADGQWHHKVLGPLYEADEPLKWKADGKMTTEPPKVVIKIYF